MTSTRATALLTGASRGIGPYIARSLADAGYQLVLASRSKPELDTVTSELRGSGARAFPVVTDLTDLDSLDLLVGAVEREYGALDVLVNNAGGDPQREFEEMSWSENEYIFRLNLLAAVQLSHRLLPGMLQRRQGHIVNISSLAGRIGFPYTEAYAAAKDGLIGFTRVLRSDYRSRGVSASVIVLGPIREAGQGQRTSDELGLKMSRFVTSPAGAVGEAVVRAIRKDRAEIVVMPGPGRLVKALMDLFPTLGPAMNERAGTSEVMRQVIDHRAGKAHPDTHAESEHMSPGAALRP
jgi:short-subunit dehydrogenase